MPHKSKRKSQLDEARAAKQRRVNSGAHSTCAKSDDPEIIPNFSDYESDDDPTYDVNAEVLKEDQAISLHSKE